MRWEDLELAEKLGEGKAGEVFRATNCDKRTRNRHPVVAVKRYKPWVTHEPGQMERIVRELHAGRIGTHPNLIRTLELIFDANGLPALVMEFYQGETLEDFLEHRGYGLTLDEVVRISLQVARALGHLHDSAVVHRDVKPANILLVDGKPILMDLGVVKPSTFPEQTETDTFLGTIRYAAPEMLFGERYDSRVDIYSLGLVMSEMVYRKRFLGEVSNWAKIVVRKNQASHPIPDRWPNSFSKECGLGAAHFFDDLIRSTACNLDQRKPDVAWVIGALESNIWLRTFHFSSGDFIEGEPAGLSEIKAKVIGRLRGGLRAKIRALVEKEYPCRGGNLPYAHHHGVPLTESEWDELIELHPYFSLNDSGAGYRRAGWEGLGFSLSIHSSIFLLYRYGYL